MTARNQERLSRLGRAWTALIIAAVAVAVSVIALGVLVVAGNIKIS